MGNVDKVFTKKEKNLRRRTEDRQKRKSKEEKDSRTREEKISLLASSWAPAGFFTRGDKIKFNSQTSKTT